MQIRNILCAALSVGFILNFCSIARADADSELAKKIVTSDRFNKLIDITRKLYKRIDELESKLALQSPASSNPASKAEIEHLHMRVNQLETELKGDKSLPAPGSAPKDGAVSLDDLDSAPAKSAGKDHPQPLLKVYFDLNFYSLPGGPSQGSGLTFDNFHSFVLLDIIPNEDISFSTIVESSPHYFELDYKLAHNVTLRMGKIEIPFDEMSPHNLFGGRTNVSRITVGDPFLPDLFTDLGIGLRMKLLDSSALSLTADAYLVNGFQSGGTDPITANSLYPNFSTLPTGADNNRDKAYGGRAHALFGNFWGIGASGYTCRWSNKDDAKLGLSMVGVDSQLNFGSTFLHGGIASMAIQLPSTATSARARRGGSYIELGQKIGAADQWTFMLRGGTLNLDDRVVDRNDKQIVGAKLMWKPNLLEWSIEHSRDLKVNAAKGNMSFTNFRVVASF